MSKLLKKDCPYCNAASVFPKRDVVANEEAGKLYKCGGCNEPVAFAGNWEVFATGVDLKQLAERLEQAEDATTIEDVIEP